MNIYQKPYHYLITQQEEKTLQEIITELSDEYILSFDNNPTLDFKKFETFSALLRYKNTLLN